MPKAVEKALNDVGDFVMDQLPNGMAVLGFIVGGPDGASIGYSLGKAAQKQLTGNTGKSSGGGDGFVAQASGRDQLVRSSVANRTIIYGRAMVSGPLVFAVVSGASNANLHMVIPLADHEIDAIEDIYFNDIALGVSLSSASPTASVASGLYAGHASFTLASGTPDQAANAELVALNVGWTAAHTLSGVAYLVVKFTFSRDVYPTGLPNVKCVVRGKKLYDPRASLTAWSANPALQVRDYLTGSYGLEANNSDDPRENLLTYSTTPNTWASYNDATGTHTTSVVTDPTYGEVVRITKTAGANGVRVGLSIGVTGLSGDGYTTSIYCKTNVALSAGSSTYVDAAKVGGGLVVVATPVSGTVGVWTRATASAIGPLAGSANFYVLMSGPIGSSIDIVMPQLNLGPTALPYSPTTTTPLLRTTSEVNDTLIVAAANVCDESVAVVGGTEARYTGNGVVDLGDTPRTIIENVLSSMVGFVVWSGGKYLTYAGAYSAPAVTITADDLRGPVRVRPRISRRDLFNGVRGTFVDPTAFWQPTDFPTVSNATYAANDGGQVIWRDVALPFTTSSATAQRIAKLMLERSRQGITVEMQCKLTVFKVATLDTVMVTIPQLGWAAKEFKVLEWSFAPEGGVDLLLQEETAASYNWDSGMQTVVDPAPDTNLGNPLVVAAPGTPSVTESLYQTTGSAGVKTRATVAWSAVDDVFVKGYLPEYKVSTSPDWITLPELRDTTVDLSDLAVATYHFRVRAINTLGVKSPYTATTTKELQGLTAPPADITGFYVTKVGGLAVADWSLVPDLDVRIGGRVVIRHSPQTTVATWADGIILNEFGGDTVTATLPLMTGTYMCKAKDSTDNYSTNMVAFVATAGLVTGFTTVATTTQHPAFTGAKTNTAVVSGGLQLDGTLLFDSAAGLFDATSGSFDVQGGLSLTGSYEFDTYTDLTTVATRRLEARIKVYSFDTASLFDDRSGLFDDGGTDFDGTAINDCDATLYYSTTDTDPAGAPVWGPWTPFFVADVSCRAVRFKLDFLSANPTHNIAATTLAVDIKTSP